MLAVNYIDEFGEFVGEDGFKVMVFVDVVFEVIEERLSLTDDEFPVALPYANHLRRTVAHLPIEEVVLALTTSFSFAKHGGAEEDAIERRGPEAVRLNLFLIERAAILHEGWHEVVEGKLKVAYRALWDAFAPADEGDADAAFLSASLDAA